MSERSAVGEWTTVADPVGCSRRRSPCRSQSVVPGRSRARGQSARYPTWDATEFRLDAVFVSDGGGHGLGGALTKTMSFTWL